MYAELHTRSAFSFLEGASLPEGLIAQAAALEIPAVALLDRDSVSGMVRFHQAAKKAGVKAIVGAEVTAIEGFRYPLIVETREGYQNLCRLLTRVKMRRQAGASKSDIEEYSKGLICLTRGVDLPWETLLGIFGRENVFAEVQRHFIREEEEENQLAIERAGRLGIPLLATNGVCHALAQERELMDVLTCTRHKTTIHNAGELLAINAERHFKTGRYMERLFRDVPDAVANSGELANRIGYTLKDLGYQFPKYPVGDNETMDSFLWKRVDEGARERFRPYHDRARAQIERELKLIEKLGLAGYFLIVWDIVQFCRREGILVQGRGSAANSAVCFALGITAVDPIKMELLFERFLSEERGEWPDIDVDLPSGDDREKVIQYVYRRYGERGAAMTANVISYRTRSAVRDVGKALGFDEETLTRLSRLSARGEWEAARERGSSEKQFRAAELSLDSPLVAKFLKLSQEILDLPRHLGQHSGGMIICQGELDGIVPLQPATMPGRVVVQWDKEDCADMGIIKIDLLGLGMMAALRDSVALIKEHEGVEVDLAQLPQDDPAVYGALQRADTVGLFQVESRAQMSCLPRLKPKEFYDIVVQVAIIRPGPIVGKMMHPYLRRREGDEEPTCLHPLLESVLSRTLGVPLFQEQLLQMAMRVADFTGGEAEELRRAMGFKRSKERMVAIERRLREGMKTKGITGEVQDTIVQSITSFALYGFPESHAISFALIAYASAYLKCHHLAAFTAALLNNQPMGFYSPMSLVKDAQRHGLRFRPVDVTKSQWPCTLEHDGHALCLRLGMNYVKGLTERSGKRIVIERDSYGFSSIYDLASRVGLSKRELNTLAELGALNFIGDGNRHRRDSLWAAESAARSVGPLFEGIEKNNGASPLPAMRDEERLISDIRNSSLSIGRHLMRFRREELNEMGVLRAADVASIKDGMSVRIAGLVICRQQPGTAKGFVFLSLEDETGIANAILRPNVFERYRRTVLGSQILVVHGVLQNHKGVVSVKAQHIESLEGLSAVTASHDFR
jgi:error-prone DNA polymerase